MYSKYHLTYCVPNQINVTKLNQILPKAKKVTIKRQQTCSFHIISKNKSENGTITLTFAAIIDE